MALNGFLSNGKIKPLKCMSCGHREGLSKDIAPFERWNCKCYCHKFSRQKVTERAFKYYQSLHQFSDTPYKRRHRG